jgi:WhiB family redox-sensing transcriptional regulator
VSPLPAWFNEAACRGKTATMYPEAHGHRDPYAAALAVCRTCPVKGACLRYALANEEHFGVWGGCTPEQRWRIMGRRGKAASAA